MNKARDNQMNSSIGRATTHEFYCEYPDVIDKVLAINVKRYSRNRNYIEGDVSRLSPFVTHGVISTRHLAARAVDKRRNDTSQKEIEKFIFQLAWRDFFHRVWESKGDDVFENIVHSQLDYGHIRGQMPHAIIHASTGIQVVDNALRTLYSTGYIHNHERMWLASIVANLARTDWRVGAKWMHYHLLDGDLASNTLSWQWVTGTFSHKQYIANQENLNKYATNSDAQQNTFLDVSYDALANLETPQELIERSDWSDDVFIPDSIQQASLAFGQSKRFFVRSMYHLDPSWHAGEDGQHVIVIEPRVLNRFPLSELRWDFIQHWASQITANNARPVIILYAYFNDVFRQAPQDITVVRQAHRACSQWQCKNMTVEDYPWLFPELDGAYPSFFKFWRIAQTYLQKKEWLDSIALESLLLKSLHEANDAA